MSKKRILFAAAAATVAIGAGLGTFAAFNDTDTTDAANAAAGTLYFDGGGVQQSGAWTLTNLKPGQSVGTKTYTIKNAGSLDGTLNLTLTVTGAPDVDDTMIGSAPGIESEAENGAVTPDSELTKNLIATIDLLDANDAPIRTLHDGVLTGLTADDWTLTEAGVSLGDGVTVKVRVTFTVADAGNELQGDGAAFVLKADLVQA